MASKLCIDGVLSDMRIEEKGTSFHESDFWLLSILCPRLSQLHINISLNIARTK